MKILLPDFNAKLGRQYILRPTNRNNSSHNNTNGNGVRVVKHNSQLLKVTDA
jgi:calcineurin-like phosphoesterase